MIYYALRWIAGIALYWFYRDIRIVGAERIPAKGPLIIAVNHHNALVDSLVVGWVMPRRIAMTAKATLAENPLVALLFQLVNVVPLRRASDELRNKQSNELDKSRNVGAFAEILRLLESGGAVLIFPEGKSHNEPRIEPLKTGLARIALQAREEYGLRNLRILPVGLTFEDKGTPGTVVGVRIAPAVEMDQWTGNDPIALTNEISIRLKSVSENVEMPPAAVKPCTSQNWFRTALIGFAARWGRTTHELPIRLARNLAVRRSTDADQPAMLTIMFGIGFVLVTYSIQLVVLGMLAHSILFLLIYLTSLVVGAYWAAFESRTH